MKKSMSFFLAVVLLMAVLCGSVFITAGAESSRIYEGEILQQIPSATTDKKAVVTDASKIYEGEFKMTWEEYEGASGYAVRVFFNINYMNKKKLLNFIYDQEIKTDKNEVTVSGLQYGRRYTVVVYALDDKGKDIAIYDRIRVFTYPNYEFEEDPDNAADVNSDGKILGLTVTQLIIVVASVATLVVVVTIMIILIMLRKPKNKVTE